MRRTGRAAIFAAAAARRSPAPAPSAPSSIESDEKFCGGCGRPLDGPQLGEAIAGSAPTSPPAAALEGERRQVTVLFCDLAGFTRLTRELGAEATHALTDRFFALTDGVIERFGGSVDKHIGDCVMAVFGAPVAHDNDAERAVRAALGIREAMPGLSRELGTELGVHVGIASGQVVASGGAGHRQYAVTGNSVNLASRLSDAAPAGTILVSDAVRRILAERLDCTPLGALAVKGLSDPVQAFRLTGLHAHKTAGRPFVGRRTEIHQLEGTLEACIESGAGQAIYLRGEAGIGKTRLIEESQEQAEALGFASHTGLVLDFGLAGGRDAIREVARSLLGVSITSSPAATEAAAEQAVRERWLAPDRRVHLNDLLDLPQPLELRALYDAMDNATRSRGKQETLAELVVQASRQRPRLIVVEDLHWADPLTLEHLANLTETVVTCPVVLVMTSRLEGDPLDAAWRARVGGSPLLTIDLGPLRPDEATRSLAPTSTRAVISPGSASSGRPAIRSSSSSCCVTSRTARRAACRAPCRAWCRPGSTICRPPTARRCRRPRCSGSAFRRARSVTCSSDRTTTAARSCAISSSDPSVMPSCSPTH